MDIYHKRGIINFFKKPRNILITTLVIVVFVGILLSIYFMFIYSFRCVEETCFAEKIVKCKKASYIDINPETVKEYKILGRENGGCEIEVQILQIRQGSVELASLEKKSMICLVPLGTYTAPESDIRNCHGILKEEIQEAIIQRMHSQIVENIGKISEELTEII